jgi:hypothetical protein
MQSFAFNPLDALGSVRCDWEDIEPPTPRAGARFVRCRKCGTTAWTRAPNEDTITVGGCGGRGKAIDGPGSELKALLQSLRVDTSASCQCEARAAQMNAWGPGVCRVRREEIVAWLKKSYAKTSWPSVIRSARSAAFGRIGISLAIAYARGGTVGVLGWLVDEAVRRAEAKVDHCA